MLLAAHQATKALNKNVQIQILIQLLAILINAWTVTVMLMRQHKKVAMQLLLKMRLVILQVVPAMKVIAVAINTVCVSHVLNVVDPKKMLETCTNFH